MQMDKISGHGQRSDICGLGGKSYIVVEFDNGTALRGHVKR